VMEQVHCLGVNGISIGAWPSEGIFQNRCFE
jgi:hypothetical protein